MGVKIGNKNKIKNSTIIGDSQINISLSEQEPAKKSFWQGVLQNITSNLIWRILGLILILSMGMLTVLNWDIIIKFIFGR